MPPKPSYHNNPSLAEARAALEMAQREGAATDIQRVVRGHQSRKRTAKKGGRRRSRRRHTRR